MSQDSETSDMTSEWLGEMFEGDYVRQTISSHVNGGPSGGSSMRRLGSEEISLLFSLLCKLKIRLNQPILVEKGVGLSLAI